MTKRKPIRTLADAPSGDLCRVSVWVMPMGPEGSQRAVRMVDGGTVSDKTMVWPGELDVVEHRTRERRTDYDNAGDVDPMRSVK